eukprot:853744-Pleurochrysis_carterae.AAC.1
MLFALREVDRQRAFQCACARAHAGSFAHVLLRERARSCLCVRAHIFRRRDADTHALVRMNARSRSPPAAGTAGCGSSCPRRCSASRTGTRRCAWACSGRRCAPATRPQKTISAKLHRSVQPCCEISLGICRVHLLKTGLALEHAIAVLIVAVVVMIMMIMHYHDHDHGNGGDGDDGDDNCVSSHDRETAGLATR